jgi:hypothetical protein
VHIRHLSDCAGLGGLACVIIVVRDDASGVEMI